MIDFREQVLNSRAAIEIEATEHLIVLGDPSRLTDTQLIGAVVRSDLEDIDVAVYADSVKPDLGIYRIPDGMASSTKRAIGRHILGQDCRDALSTIGTVLRNVPGDLKFFGSSVKVGIHAAETQHPSTYLNSSI
ncbi:MAG: hypothetical protein ACI9T8_000457 [Candidatus Saccharimonadales bacterium]|jgi:hypothetical protein